MILVQKRMRVLAIVFALFLKHLVSQHCPDAVNKQGHFYRRISKPSDEENNATDEPKINPQFFKCGRKESCTHVVKFKDTSTYQMVYGEADLKKIKRPNIVWEKVKKSKKEWIVFQRRVDGSVNFQCNWTDYKSGFGEPSGNFWLGLDKLHALARPGKGAILNITMKHRDYPEKLFHATYTIFEMGNEAAGYRLNIGGYSGNAGDSLAYHNGMKFSTHDRDNDISTRNCASYHKGGWWYKNCYEANLNNLHNDDKKSSATTYMTWASMSGSFGNVAMSEMKVKNFAKDCEY